MSETSNNGVSMVPHPQIMSRASRQFNAAIISGSDIFTLGMRYVLHNDLGANAICVFSAPEQLSMIHVTGIDSIDIVVIDDDALLERKASFRWINGLEGLAHCGVIVLAGAYSLESVKLKLRGGARACVNKRTSFELLAQAIETVLKGEYWVEEEFRKHFTSAGELQNDDVVSSELFLLSTLTPSEQVVISNLITGMTVSEIAHQINRSVKTVSAQKQSGMRKLQVDTLIALSKLFDRQFVR